jgi:hypothetical protein
LRNDFTIKKFGRIVANVAVLAIFTFKFTEIGEEDISSAGSSFGVV